MEVKVGISTVDMKNGENGATFKPQIINGILSWTNDKGLPNPTPFNLLPNITGGFTQDIYVLDDTQYYRNGKVVMTKIGNMLTMNMYYEPLASMPQNFKMGTVGLQYVPTSSKLITAANTGGFTFLTIESDGSLLFYSGDQGKVGGKQFIDLIYSIY